MQPYPGPEAFQEVVAAAGASKIVLLKFGATWCRPCKAVAPVVNGMVRAYSELVTGFDVDIDKFPDLSKTYEVTSVPTFVVLSESGVITKWTGSDALQFEQNLVDCLGWSV